MFFFVDIIYLHINWQHCRIQICINETSIPIHTASYDRSVVCQFHHKTCPAHCELRFHHRGPECWCIWRIPTHMCSFLRSLPAQVVHSDCCIVSWSYRPICLHPDTERRFRSSESSSSSSYKTRLRIVYIFTVDYCALVSTTPSQ